MHKPSDVGSPLVNSGIQLHSDKPLGWENKDSSFVFLEIRIPSELLREPSYDLVLTPRKGGGSELSPEK